MDAAGDASNGRFPPARDLLDPATVITPALILYVALTLVLAALIVTHAALVLRVVRDRGLRHAWAALPPATPVVAWRTGARVGPVVWGTLLVGYAILLIAAHA